MSKWDNNAFIQPYYTLFILICNVHNDWKNKKHITDTAELEMYQAGRYFTVTGNKFNDVSNVEEREANTQAVYNCYFTDNQPIVINNNSCYAVKPK